MSDTRKLYASFSVGGDCKEPLPQTEVAALVAPPEIKEMLQLSREWHLLQAGEHCGVYGVNLFDSSGVWLDKTAIIGDTELVQQWADEHGTPNCAEEGWECFAAVSEYDFLFVCLSPGEQFGATRRMVNNCWEDTFLTPAPFSCFLERLHEYLEAFNEKKGEEEEDEETDFFSFFK
eukprot:TRINITY_DN76228_c0_g1_i1.p1 TRINITY_DN76228_c0_g1~~TRINITY_DN76228_c0_g1_i1.p1  ORF type:complete len:176 (-),score=70.25 TRINITY_DN76228_c0_g1_i1:66-593(-)